MGLQPKSKPDAPFCPPVKRYNSVIEGTCPVYDLRKKWGQLEVGDQFVDLTDMSKGVTVVLAINRGSGTGALLAEIEILDNQKIDLKNAWRAVRANESALFPGHHIGKIEDQETLSQLIEAAWGVIPA